MPRKLALLLGLTVSLLAAALSTTPALGAGLVAPPGACPSQESLDAPAPVQEQAMLCMVGFARAQLGLGTLEDTGSLEESARDKSRDIFECDSFSHSACGREFTYWMRETGYLSLECWRVGENLAWGIGEYGTVRAIFRAWLRSPEHRRNILGNYSQTGIDLRTGTLAGAAGTHVWTQHFGLPC